MKCKQHKLCNVTLFTEWQTCKESLYSHYFSPFVFQCTSAMYSHYFSIFVFQCTSAMYSHYFSPFVFQCTSAIYSHYFSIFVFQCTGALCQPGQPALSRTVEIRTSVTFIDVSDPPVGVEGQYPTVPARLPYDFFYPFTDAAPKQHGASLPMWTVFLLTVLYSVLW